MFVYEVCIKSSRSTDEEDYVHLFSQPSGSASDTIFSQCAKGTPMHLRQPSHYDNNQPFPNGMINLSLVKGTLKGST